MKKIYWLGLGVLLVGLGWVLLMTYINSRLTIFDVYVAAEVDEVQFYQAAHPEEPIAAIQTQAEDATAVIELRNSASHSLWIQGAPTQYYFTAVKDNESYRSPIICCETGITNRRGTLTIHDLHDWQQTSP